MPADARTHPDSQRIMRVVTSEAKNLRLAKRYTVPVWVVDSEKIPPVRVRSDYIFDTWDKNKDGWSDVGIPYTPAMWWEPTSDGHLCIVDPGKNVSWEMSKFQFIDGTAQSTTFNIWDLKGTGVGDSNEGKRWVARGGRGSGFPIIAGLIRPEELKAGEIRHALVFVFKKNRRALEGKQIFVPPASRSDGKFVGDDYPIEGMLFQLDPALSEKDFSQWGLGREAMIVARALQRYGMYLGDNGGAMTLQPQLLGPSQEEHLRQWESLFPGFFRDIEKIPSSAFRVIYTGEPIKK